jgi:hypothetical protein
MAPKFAYFTAERFISLRSDSPEEYTPELKARHATSISWEDSQSKKYVKPVFGPMLAGVNYHKGRYLSLTATRQICLGLNAGELPFIVEVLQPVDLLYAIKISESERVDIVPYNWLKIELCYSPVAKRMFGGIKAILPFKHLPIVFNKIQYVREAVTGNRTGVLVSFCRLGSDGVTPVVVVGWSAVSPAEYKFGCVNPTLGIDIAVYRHCLPADIEPGSLPRKMLLSYNIFVDGLNEWSKTHAADIPALAAYNSSVLRHG